MCALLMFVVCCLPSVVVVRCTSSFGVLVVGRSLFVVCCAVFVVRWLLLVVRRQWSLFVVCRRSACWLFVGCCLLFVVRCLLFGGC